MMHMTFYWSREVTLLFSSWMTDSWLTYSLTLLACVVASAVYQYVEHIRFRLRQAGKSVQGTAAQLDEPLLEGRKAATAAKKWSLMRIAEGLAFGVSSGLGYLLMLAVMSFNGGVFLAIVLGLTAGYLAFRTEFVDETTGTADADSPCACA
ncbi:hypothetical protein SLEP1_g12797 [Rubroshorea leprosula]|uniref:Copper transport protein n=1 Tax=Rubroshorea leprosula TaxID=152421 RepID=A0AAV5IDP5_9ROSI|nr:hypothetical protein SLEP1_g12797 [Rubroshorea leprosula]